MTFISKKGPPLPVSCGYPSLVTSHDGQKVYVVGCKEDGRGGRARAGRSRGGRSGG